MIYEDEDVMAFLDAFPIMLGQVLVVPKEHIDYLFDFDDKDYSKVMLITKKLVKAIDKVLKPVKTGLVVEGLEIDHAHVKLYPLFEQGFKAEAIKQPSEQEMKDISEKIKKEIK